MVTGARCLISIEFYNAQQDQRIAPSEMRPLYQAVSGDPGAVLGQLSSDLCSPWQGDFTACVGYWTEHLPETAYLDEATSVPVQLFRLTYAEHSQGANVLTDGIDFVDHVDQIGVARMRNGKLIETERGPGDDIV
jgi:hypothetical protein